MTKLFCLLLLWPWILKMKGFLKYSIIIKKNVCFVKSLFYWIHIKYKTNNLSLSFFFWFDLINFINPRGQFCSAVRQNPYKLTHKHTCTHPYILTYVHTYIRTGAYVYVYKVSAHLCLPLSLPVCIKQYCPQTPVTVLGRIRAPGAVWRSQESTYCFSDS